MASEVQPVGAYYTKTDEEHPVFHTRKRCSEGEKIEPQNREKVGELKGRDLCEVCATMEAKRQHS